MLVLLPSTATAATVTWISTASGFWDVGANWSTGNAPQAGDDVIINQPGSTVIVTIRTPTAAIQSLNSTEFLMVDSTLGLTGTALLDGGLQVNGGISGLGMSSAAVELRSIGEWRSGSLTNLSLRVGAGHTLNITTTNAHNLFGATITNEGAVNWSAGAIGMNGISQLVNANGALWDVQDTLSVVTDGNGPHTFSNAGTLRKSGGAGPFTIGGSINVSNTGTLQVQTGTFVCNCGPGMTSSGLLDVSSGATIDLSQVTLAAGSTFAGTGTLSMPGTTRLSASLTITAPVVLTSTLMAEGQTLTLAAPMSWVAGNLTNVNVTVAPGQTLSISSANAHNLFGATIANQGTVNWSAGTIGMNGISHLINAPAAQWNVQDNLSVVTDGNGPHTFNNAGTLRKTAGAGTFLLGGNVSVTNTGTLQIQTGSFMCSCGPGMTTSGTLNVSAGATIDLSQTTLAAGSTFAGGGTLTMPGTTTLAASLTVTLPIVLTSTLTGQGNTLTLGAPMSWVGGTLTNVGLTVAPGQTLSISSASAHNLFGATITNQGTVNWNAGAIGMNGISHLVNANGAQWNVLDNLLVVTDGNGPHTFNNAGTLRRSGGTGTFELGGSINVTNTGIVQIETGTFRCNCSPGMTTSGVFDVSAGATINLSQMTLAAGSSFTGGGTLTMPGTTTLSAPVTVNAAVVLTGTITGPGHTLTMAAPMTWTSGNLTNAGLTIAAGQTLSITTTNGHQLFGATLTNQGTVNWSAGGIGLNGISHLVNASGAQWNVLDNLSVVTDGNGPHTFLNAGTLTKTGPLGTFSVAGNLTFTNTGTVGIRLGGLGPGTFDQIVTSTVTLAGTLDVTLVNGFVPAFRDSWNVITYGLRTGAFAAVLGNNGHYVARYPANVVSLRNSVADPNMELIRNGTFTDQLNFWQTFATPDMSYIVASAASGALEFYRVPPPPGTSNQATVFQETEAYLPADAPIIATFDLENTSSARKRISVIMTDSDFGDLAVCTFWLAPNAPSRNYGMRSHTTQLQGNVALYFYAATAGSSGGAYRIDNVSMKWDPALAFDRTDCLDPTAPGPTVDPESLNLIVNGDFAGPTIAPWAVFGTITAQVAGGVLEFIRPSSAPPAGVVLQAVNLPLPAGRLLTTTLDLGNSSSVRKRVTVLIHDLDFGDLAACTFWLAPGQPLTPYGIRSYTTRPWTSPTVSVYPATTGLDQWTRLDNVTFRSTPSIIVTGTECLEPGANVTRPLSSRPMSVAPTAMTVPAASIAEGSVTAVAESAVPAPAVQAATQAAMLTSPTTFTPRTEWRRVLDLRSVTDATLSLEMATAGAGSSGLAQVSLNGVDWITIAAVPASTGRTTIDVDLSAFVGEVVHVRVVSLYPGHRN